MVTVLCKRKTMGTRFCIRVLSRDDIREFKKKNKQTKKSNGNGNVAKKKLCTTMAVYVHYNSQYISLRSSVKQQREMTKFCIVWRT